MTIRILHINNTANTAVELRDGQRALGHEADVAQTFRGALPYNWPEDYRFYGDRGAFSKLHLLAGLLVLGRQYDVLHVHGQFPDRLLGALSVLRKPIVCHFKGDDVRTGEWRGMARWASDLWCSTPDLRRGCPATWVPNPCSVRYRARFREDADPLRVVHAHGAYKVESLKGSDTIRRILSSIPGVEYLEITGKSRDEALRLYATADLAVDQMRIGWYGMFAAECMLMGIPTLGYVDPRIPFQNPIYPVTDHTLRAAVEAMRDDPELRRRTAMEQHRLTSERHDPLAIAEWTILNYPRRAHEGYRKRVAYLRKSWRDWRGFEVDLEAMRAVTDNRSPTTGSVRPSNLFTVLQRNGRRWE